MGSLSFSIGRWVGFSSGLAFAKPEQKPGIDLSQVEIALDEKALRAIDEFNSGMKMLLKHGVHNGCNIQRIAQQNLKLLHTNLKTSKVYRDSITTIRTAVIESPRWSWIPLADKIDLKAGFIYLAAGKTVTLKQPGSTTLRQNTLYTPFSEAVNSHLYLGLMGVTQIECLEPSFQTSTRNIKIGEAYAEDTRLSTVHRVTATREASLLLNIQLEYNPS